MKSARPSGLVLAALLSCLLLAACLGIDTPPYQSKPGYPGSASSAQFSTQLFKQVNEYRQKQGYKPLEWDPALAELAAQHAVDMAQRTTLDHAGFKDRYLASGYRMCVENAASSAGSPLEVLGIWQRSPGHDANLKNADVKRVGIAKSGRFISLLACEP